MTRRWIGGPLRYLERSRANSKTKCEGRTLPNRRFLLHPVPPFPIPRLSVFTSPCKCANPWQLYSTRRTNGTVRPSSALIPISITTPRCSEPAARPAPAGLEGLLPPRQGFAKEGMEQMRPRCSRWRCRRRPACPWECSRRGLTLTREAFLPQNLSHIKSK